MGFFAFRSCTRGDDGRPSRQTIRRMGQTVNAKGNNAGRTMKRTGAQIIIELLERQGVRTIAGIPGGANLPLYDALGKSRLIHHVLARHEQAAGFMAQGIARATGEVGVCFATSGRVRRTFSPPSPSRTWTASPWCAARDRCRWDDRYGCVSGGGRFRHEPPHRQHSRLVKDARGTA